MYVQQRDEYLESFCKMATRKVSVITIFGPVSNSTMKIDHFQLGSLKQLNHSIIAFLLAKVGGAALWERSVGNQKENLGFTEGFLVVTKVSLPNHLCNCLGWFWLKF